MLPDPLGKSPLLHRWDGSNAIATQKTNISSSLFHYVPRMARSAASQPLLLAGPLDAGPSYGPLPALPGQGHVGLAVDLPLGHGKGVALQNTQGPKMPPF